MFVLGVYASYKRQGSGETVLLLHGYNSQKESFYYQFAELKNFDLIAPDMPSFGKTPMPRAYDLDDYVAWVREFKRKLGVNKTHIIAHSFGARVAIKLAANYPDEVGKLVIVGGAGIRKTNATLDKKVARYRRVKRFFPKFAERHFGSKEYRALSPMKRESFKKIVGEDLRQTAERITAPTLLIYGEDDRTTPYEEEGETFRRHICGGQLVKMQGGHFCFVENYTKFNQLVKKFLE